MIRFPHTFLFSIVSMAWASVAWVLIACVLVVWATRPVQAESRLQAACFTPADLAQRAGEQSPVKFDRPMSVRMPTMSPLSSSPAALRGAIRRVELPKGQKLVALTLDLCEISTERAGYDGAIIDYLRSQGVKATIFSGGKWMATHPERTRQLIADNLFEIGTHNWGHRNVRGLKGADLVREITAPSAIFGQARAALAAQQCVAPFAKELAAIPATPRLYRFPFGACSAEALDTVQAAGLLAIQWDVSTGDAAPTQSAAAIAQQVVAHTRPGSIIIAHANGRGINTAAALPLVIPALRAKGFQFVTVSELLAAGRPVVAETCYDSRPGDTDKYDALFLPKTVPAVVPGVEAGRTPRLVTQP